MQLKQAQEGIARRIIVDCGFGTDYPCPHTPEGNPFGTNEPCPHLDEDVCMWQREQAAEFLSVLFTPEEIEEWKKGGYPAIVCKDQSLPENPYPKTRTCADEDGCLTEYIGQEYNIYNLARLDVFNAGFRRVKSRRYI